MPSSVHLQDRLMSDAEPQQKQEQEREEQEHENIFEINEGRITVVCRDCLPILYKPSVSTLSLELEFWIVCFFSLSHCLSLLWISV